MKNYPNYDILWWHMSPGLHRLQILVYPDTDEEFISLGEMIMCSYSSVPVPPGPGLFELTCVTGGEKPSRLLYTHPGALERADALSSRWRTRDFRPL